MIKEHKNIEAVLLHLEQERQRKADLADAALTTIAQGDVDRRGVSGSRAVRAHTSLSPRAVADRGGGRGGGGRGGPKPYERARHLFFRGEQVTEAALCDTSRQAYFVEDLDTFLEQKGIDAPFREKNIDKLGRADDKAERARDREEEAREAQNQRK